MEENRHFSAVVVGENPNELLGKYDKNKKVDEYVAFRLSDAGKYKQTYLNNLKNTIDNINDTKLKTILTEDYEFVSSMDDVDYYIQLTSGYALDETTGNVILNENPNGKYDWCRLGKDLCMPMIDKKGNEVFQARKKDIDWSKTHLFNSWSYETVWDLVIGGKIPESEEEEKLYENMKNRKDYFNFFGNKENYVLSNTAFWGYAFVDESGWYEIEFTPQVEWIKNFYNKFIEHLSEDTKISIFECFRK